MQRHGPIMWTSYAGHAALMRLRLHRGSSLGSNGANGGWRVRLEQTQEPEEQDQRAAENGETSQNTNDETEHVALLGRKAAKR